MLGKINVIYQHDQGSEEVFILFLNVTVLRKDTCYGVSLFYFGEKKTRGGEGGVPPTKSVRVNDTY